MINFQNNLTWPKSNTPQINLHSGLKHSIITLRNAKHSPFTWLLYWKLLIDTHLVHCICQFVSPVLWRQWQRVFWSSCTSARHDGRFGCLINMILTMTEGTVHDGRPARFPTKSIEKIKNWKMYATKPNMISAEYQDMLHRPRLDLSGTPGLWHISCSPDSWHTSLCLGSTSLYFIQILICISYNR